ncbi:hypothetical protein ACF0H5_020270 [Mactra antiquata]
MKAVLTQPRGSNAGANPALAQLFSAQKAGKPAGDGKGTDSGQVKLNLAGNKTGGGAGVNMMATALITSRLKSNLERKRSLNPRMMPPPGLEVLDDQPLIAVRQQMDVDKYGGCGAPNTYKLFDQSNEEMFIATDGGFLMHLAYGHFTCEEKHSSRLCSAIGTTTSKFSVFSPKFDIVDHDDNVLFKVQGPCCGCRCSTEIYFKIFSKTGDQQVGKIQKKWGGDRTDNINVDHEYFEVAFAPSLDIVDKGLILGAAFLVVCMTGIIQLVYDS